MRHPGAPQNRKMGLREMISKVVAVVFGLPLSVENAPACYRAPGWPDPEFSRKSTEKYPLARNSGLPEFAPKIPKKYPQNTPNHRFGIFSVFLGYFLGVPKCRPAAYFFGFFVEIPFRAISGAL